MFGRAASDQRAVQRREQAAQHLSPARQQDVYLRSLGHARADLRLPGIAVPLQQGHLLEVLGQDTRSDQAGQPAPDHHRVARMPVHVFRCNDGRPRRSSGHLERPPWSRTSYFLCVHVDGSLRYRSKPSMLLSWRFLPAVLVVISCSRVIHPAAVRPGISLTIASGLEVARHEPGSSDATRPALAQFEPFHSAGAFAHLGVSYGWLFSEHVGIQIGASGGPSSAPAIDSYLQFLGVPLDAGIGVTASVNGRQLPNGLIPGVYGMLGRGWTTGTGSEVRFDVGFRWESVHVSGTGRESALNPFSSVTFLTGSRHALGLWLEGRKYTEPVLRSMCQDSCLPKDLVDSSAAAGLFVRIH